MKKEQNNLEKMRSEILQRRYLMKDDKGRVIETEDQMYWRVADTIAEVESKYGTTQKDIKTLAAKFFHLMKNGKFLPSPHIS